MTRPDATWLDRLAPSSIYICGLGLMVFMALCETGPGILQWLLPREPPPSYEALRTAWARELAVGQSSSALTTWVHPEMAYLLEAQDWRKGRAIYNPQELTYRCQPDAMITPDHGFPIPENVVFPESYTRRYAAWMCVREDQKDERPAKPWSSHFRDVTTL